MHFIKATTVSIAALTLAACGGSGGENPVEGVDFQTTNGVIADLELPTAEQIAELPSGIADTVNAFIATNENEIATPTLPSGTADYSGSWAMGQNDNGEEDGGGDALVGGLMALNVDFNEALVFGRLDVNYAYDDDGNSLAITGNPLEVHDIDIFAAIEEGEITGNINGRFNVEDEVVNIGGTLDGSFTGDGATGAVGTLLAQTTYDDGGQDGFDGIFEVSEE